MACATSLAFNPAISSSSSKSSGLVANAEATSTRFWLARVRSLAGLALTSDSPTNSSVSAACAAASAEDSLFDVPNREPKTAFSKTAMFGKTLTDWKVLANPILQMRCGFRPLIFSPLKVITPGLGTRAPEIRLNSVVLPAPLGPIKPTISPWSTWKSTRETAANPPKCLVTPSPSSIGMLPSLEDRSPALLDQPHKSTGEVRGRDHKYGANKEHVVIGKLGEKCIFQIGTDR